jgi:hypothetical protein
MGGLVTTMGVMAVDTKIYQSNSLTKWLKGIQAHWLKEKCFGKTNCEYMSKMEEMHTATKKKKQNNTSV